MPEKNGNGEMKATLLQILAELRADGRRMDQQIIRMDQQIHRMDQQIQRVDQRLKSLEAWQMRSEARMLKMDENIRKTALVLNDAAQALSEIDLRVRRVEKRQS